MMELTRKQIAEMLGQRQFSLSRVSFEGFGYGHGYVLSMPSVRQFAADPEALRAYEAVRGNTFKGARII